MCGGGIGGGSTGGGGPSSMIRFLKYNVTLLRHNMIFLMLRTFDFVILLFLCEGPVSASNTIAAIADASLSAAAFFFLYAIKAFFNEDIKSSSSSLSSRFLAATAYAYTNKSTLISLSTFFASSELSFFRACESFD